ncbi:unnamed protein product [Soboliphyme baturini]|uniref:ATP-dependent RNA helicase n=1 Tax=Soboliphyme baturini TaxID=241478 RepID=A0A183IYL8_9BILA|nr:unnamed protein product [Soboliphyme baturini]
MYAKMATKLANNVKGLNFATPTAIQMQVVPLMLQRREVMACAPTGSGKTLAFVVPVLHDLLQGVAAKPDDRKTRVLVVEPTRELARQTYSSPPPAD